MMTHGTGTGTIRTDGNSETKKISRGYEGLSCQSLAGLLLSRKIKDHKKCKNLERTLTSKIGGEDMKKIIFSPVLFFVAFHFIASQGCVSLPPSPPETKPVITHAFINKEKGRYGDILKIYIEADDPKGFMSKITTVVDQVGYGHYPTNWIFLEPPYAHHLIGYLQWNTFSSHASRMQEWTQITIKVSILDAAGNESNEVVFPFTFVSEVVPKSPLPAPFNRGKIPRLGFIDINLYNPFEMGGEEEKNL
jgi:hypothetical protein